MARRRSSIKIQGSDAFAQTRVAELLEALSAEGQRTADQQQALHSFGEYLADCAPSLSVLSAELLLRGSGEEQSAHRGLLRECGCPSASDPLSLRESNADVLRLLLLLLAPATCEDSESGGDDDQPAAAARATLRAVASRLPLTELSAARLQQHVRVPETLEDALALVDALATMRKTVDAGNDTATELVAAMLGHDAEAMDLYALWAREQHRDGSSSDGESVSSEVEEDNEGDLADSWAAVRELGWLDEIDDQDSKGTPDATGMAGMGAATRLLASMMAGSAAEHGGQEEDDDKRSKDPLGIVQEDLRIVCPAWNQRGSGRNLALDRARASMGAGAGAASRQGGGGSSGSGRRLGFGAAVTAARQRWKERRQLRQHAPSATRHTSGASSGAASVGLLLNAALGAHSAASVHLHERNFDADAFLTQVHGNTGLVELQAGAAHLQQELAGRGRRLERLVLRDFSQFVACTDAIGRVRGLTAAELRRKPKRADLEREAAEEKKRQNAGVIDVMEALKMPTAAAISRAPTSVSQGTLKSESKPDSSPLDLLAARLGRAVDGADAVFTPLLQTNTQARAVRNALAVLKRFETYFELPRAMRAVLERHRSARADSCVIGDSGVHNFAPLVRAYKTAQELHDHAGIAILQRVLDDVEAVAVTARNEMWAALGVRNARAAYRAIGNGEGDLAAGMWTPTPLDFAQQQQLLAWLHDLHPNSVFTAHQSNAKTATTMNPTSLYMHLRHSAVRRMLVHARDIYLSELRALSTVQCPAEAGDKTSAQDEYGKGGVWCLNEDSAAGDEHSVGQQSPLQSSAADFINVVSSLLLENVPQLHALTQLRREQIKRDQTTALRAHLTWGVKENAEVEDVVEHDSDEDEDVDLSLLSRLVENGVNMLRLPLLGANAELTFVVGSSEAVVRNVVAARRACVRVRMRHETTQAIDPVSAILCIARREDSRDMSMASVESGPASATATDPEDELEFSDGLKLPCAWVPVAAIFAAITFGQNTTLGDNAVADENVTDIGVERAHARIKREAVRLVRRLLGARVQTASAVSASSALQHERQFHAIEHHADTKIEAGDTNPCVTDIFTVDVQVHGLPKSDFATTEVKDCAKGGDVVGGAIFWQWCAPKTALHETEKESERPIAPAALDLPLLHTAMQQVNDLYTWASASVAPKNNVQESSGLDTAAEALRLLMRDAGARLAAALLERVRGRTAELLDEHITAWQGVEATGEAVFSFRFARTARRLRSLPLLQSFFSHVETALDELKQALPAPLRQQFQLRNVVCNGIKSCFAAFRATIEHVARKQAQSGGDRNAGDSSKYSSGGHGISLVDDTLKGKAIWPRARRILQCAENCSNQEDHVVQLFQAALTEDDVSAAACPNAKLSVFTFSPSVLLLTFTTFHS
eukprot:g2406.t1